MDVLFKAKCIVGGREVDDCTPVNPGHLVGSGWLVNAGWGNSFSNFLVEAPSIHEAIEVFADSKYGHLILVDESYIDEAKLEGYIGEYRDWETDRKSTRLNSSHLKLSRMPSSA